MSHSSGNAPPLLLLLGFFACFGLIFLVIVAGYIRFFLALKKSGAQGLTAAPLYCPHCGAETLRTGRAWFPTSPGAAIRASGIRVGPFMIGGPMTRMGWSCVKCGGTMDKAPTST